MSDCASSVVVGDAGVASGDVTRAVEAEEVAWEAESGTWTSVVGAEVEVVVILNPLSPAGGLRVLGGLSRSEPLE